MEGRLWVRIWLVQSPCFWATLIALVMPFLGLIVFLSLYMWTFRVRLSSLHSITKNFWPFICMTPACNVCLFSSRIRLSLTIAQATFFLVILPCIYSSGLQYSSCALCRTSVISNGIFCWYCHPEAYVLPCDVIEIQRFQWTQMPALHAVPLPKYTPS